MASPELVVAKVALDIDRAAWEAEYSVDTSDPTYDFEEAVQDWFVAECETMRTLGEWPALKMIHA